MTLADTMNQYFSKKTDALSVIRQLSGMFDPKHAVTLLTLICTITRHELDDIDEETFRHVWKIPTEEELMFQEGADYPQEYDKMPVESLQDELKRMVIDLDGLQKKNQESTEPIVDEDGIGIETDIVAMDHDVSLLTTYITYRMKKEEEKNDEGEDKE